MSTLLFLFFLLAAGIFGFRRWSNHAARTKLLATGLSDHQRSIVAQQVPLTLKLPAELRDTLEGKINVFLHQIQFIGCDGLEITEEMRLSIAAQACFLVVNSNLWYKHLRTILIYPGAFKSLQRSHDGYVVTEQNTARLGESWLHGPVVLSWAHSEQGAINENDGHNVVFHEFAHQIDSLSGDTDGAPILNKDQSFADWERVFVRAYERHVQNVQRRRNTVFDAYGAESHVEFFAVSVEIFFEKPVVLKREEPQVYQQLSELFGLEPATWN